MVGECDRPIAVWLFLLSMPRSRGLWMPVALRKRQPVSVQLGALRDLLTSREVCDQIELIRSLLQERGSQLAVDTFREHERWLDDAWYTVPPKLCRRISGTRNRAASARFTVLSWPSKEFHVHGAVPARRLPRRGSLLELSRHGLWLSARRADRLAGRVVAPGTSTAVIAAIVWPFMSAAPRAYRCSPRR